MEHPPLWLMLLGASFFALLTRSKAAKYKKNTTLWFWIGFIFGIWGLLAFYLTKKRSSLQTNPQEITASSKSLLTLNYSTWYYNMNQEIQGPSSADYIEKLYANGELHDQTLLWNETLTDWTELKTFKTLP